MRVSGGHPRALTDGPERLHARLARPQRVQVFSIGKPAKNTPAARRRYRVKWRVDGRDKTRAFKTRGEADRLRSLLHTAVARGEPFDVETGLPSAWVEQPQPSPAIPGHTWWTWTREWILLKWPQWSGHSRRSAVESLTAITPLMAIQGAPPPPGDLPGWLRTEGYVVHSDNRDLAVPAWLHDWSVPLEDVGPQLLERVLNAVTKRRDGMPVAPSLARRRRNSLGAPLRPALRRGLLTTNPMERVEWRAPAHHIAVDVLTVPAPAEVEAIIRHVDSLPNHRSRYATLFAMVGVAGMRPSEAIALRRRDVRLPRHGWGLATIRGALTSPGSRYTADGSVVESKGLKQRPVNATREVPLAPSLVSRLRGHLSRWEPIDDRVFSNAGGRPITSTNYERVWAQSRAQLWPAGHPLASATVYDLRHAAATMMLRAGVPPAEVARRLGHSVDVLMRVYAGVFEDERDRSNQLIERALRS